MLAPRAQNLFPGQDPVGSEIVGHFTGWETVISPIIMIIAASPAP